MSSKWLINLKPRQNELLSSWLIRSSIINGDDPTGWTQKFWGKWRVWTTDLDRQCPPEKIKILSKVSGLSESKLLSMTLQPTIENALNNKNLNPKLSWHWVIPNSKRSRVASNGLHYCADCISSKPIYFRKSWRLAWNVACPTHKSLLIINCPECSHVISPHLVTYKKTALHLCTQCGFDLRKALSFKVSDEAIELQELLNTSLSEQSIHTFPLGIATAQEFFATTLFLMRFLYSLRRYNKNYQPLISALGLTEQYESLPVVKGTTIETLHVLHRHFLLLAVSRLFQLGLKDIVLLFQEVKITQQLLNTITNHPLVIKEIGSHLVNVEKRPRKRPAIKVAVEPNSKKEVERLMDDVRAYL